MRKGQWLIGIALGLAALSCESRQAAETSVDAPIRPEFELTTAEAFDVGAVTPYGKSHDEIYAHIDAHFDEHLGNLQRWLRQPSISAQSLGIEEMAELVRSDLEGLGFQGTRIVPTSGHPGVWGHYDANAEKTLLVYLMYDVQPVNPEDWRSPPFEAELVDLPLGRALIARGATSQKGPERAFLNAVESILAVDGTLPVNLMVLAEGEEELGSPNYPELIDNFEDRLKTADGVFLPYNSQGPDGSMEVDLGVKGILYFELESVGGPHGGPKDADIHGSFKAIVDSPVLRLIQAIGSMTTPDGNTILIDGYYDDVRAPTVEEQRLINGVLPSYDPATLKKLFSVDRFIDDMGAAEALIRQLYDVTLNVDGIWAGYSGDGVKTILPHKATAKMDSRLPPNVDPDRQLERIRAHLDSRGFSDIEIRRLSGYPASQTSVDAPLVRAALAVFQKWGEVDEVWPRNAGSAPFYQFTERLGLPLVSGGLGHGSRAHAPNEYMLIEPTKASGVASLAEIEKAYADLLFAFAKGQ